MDRESIKRMSQSLRIYSRVRSLLKMSKTELADMPKEVIISCAANEIALVWDKLPQHLQNDIDILKYQFCDDHFKSTINTSDAYDGPPPRKIFCCFCKVHDVNLSNSIIMNNEIMDSESSNSRRVMLTNLCCKQQ